MPSPEPLPDLPEPAPPAGQPIEEVRAAPPPHPLSRFLRPAQLSLVVAAALIALLFHLRLPGRLTSDEDYRAVADVLAKEAQPTDAVLLFPWWTERARLFVPDALNVVGYLGAERDPLRDHPRVWVLGLPSSPNADEAAFAQAFGPSRKQVGEVRRFGNLTLALYENGRHQPKLFSAKDALASAQAYIEHGNGARAPCARSGDAFRCPGGGHLYVRAEWHEVFYEPRRCLYMHAPGGDAKLVVEFPQVPLTGEGLFEAGYVWEHAVKKGPFTTTYVAVEDPVAGRRLADLALPAGTEGFQRASVIEKREGSSPVRITVQSQRADARVVCVDLAIFGGGGGS